MASNRKILVLFGKRVPSGHAGEDLVAMRIRHPRIVAAGYLQLRMSKIVRPRQFFRDAAAENGSERGQGPIALPLASPRLVMADEGDGRDNVRANALLKGILPVIPPKADRKQPITCDSRAYKDRNRVGRMLSRLKQLRSIATRCGNTTVSFPGLLALAAAKLWFPAFVNRTHYTAFRSINGSCSVLGATSKRAPHIKSASVTARSSCPRGVRVYSTRGGTTGYTFLSMTPSASSSRSCAVNICWVTSGISRRSSPKRRVPPIRW